MSRKQKKLIRNPHPLKPIKPHTRDSKMSLDEEVKKSEPLVEEMFKKQGYAILNVNDVGFPDLIAIKDGKIAFFVEVKAMQKPELKGIYQMQYHQFLNRLGFKVRYINAKNGKTEEFYPEQDYADAVKSTNPF